MDNDILNNLTHKQIAAILEENMKLKEEKNQLETKTTQLEEEKNCLKKKILI